MKEKKNVWVKRDDATEGKEKNGENKKIVQGRGGGGETKEAFSQKKCFKKRGNGEIR